MLKNNIKHLDEKKYKQAALARREGWKARNVAYYFKKPSVQVSTLIRLSHGFRFNFLRQVADTLPADFPPHAINPLQAENEALKKEIEFLKYEIEVLERVAGVKKG